MLDETELIQGVINRNEKEYRRFIKQYERLVFYIVRKLIDNDEDVEDLAQEIFMKVFKNLPKFKSESKLSTWISQIAYRESINYLKKNKNRFEKTYELNESIGIADISLNPEELNITKDLSFFVRLGIKKLPEHYRHVLVLYHLEEFSYPEIGQITGMPEGTVKNYIFRARKLLKEYLEPKLKSELL